MRTKFRRLLLFRSERHQALVPSVCSRRGRPRATSPSGCAASREPSSEFKFPFPPSLVAESPMTSGPPWEARSSSTGGSTFRCPAGWQTGFPGDRHVNMRDPQPEHLCFDRFAAMSAPNQRPTPGPGRGRNAERPSPDGRGRSTPRDGGRQTSGQRSEVCHRVYFGAHRERNVVWRGSSLATGCWGDVCALG